MNRFIALTGIFVTFLLPGSSSVASERDRLMTRPPHSALPANFDPSGTWNLDFSNLCFGSTRYYGSSEAVVGDSFPCSQYLNVDSLNSPPVQITYNEATRTVAISGGLGDGVRTIELDESGIGIGTQPFGIQNEEVTDGCTVTGSNFEAVVFTDSNTMIYTPIFQETFPQVPACTEFLGTTVSNMIQNNSAPLIYSALAKTNGLDLANIENLETTRLFYSFAGSKTS